MPTFKTTLNDELTEVDYSYKIGHAPDCDLIEDLDYQVYQNGIEIELGEKEHEKISREIIEDIG